MKEYVCIDIGGTASKAGVLDENARIIEQLNIPTEAMQGGSYVLARVKKIIERYIVLRKITGICISTTGMVDAAQGSIIYANENMPGYMGINLKKEIERLRLENKSLSETVNYRDEELNEVKTQNNELREDINKVKGIISKY